MKPSTRGRYVTRALLELALLQSDRPVQLREVAQRQEISSQYLEHLIAPLIAAGILRSIRGAQGGLQLVKPPHEVKLIEIMRLLEGSIAGAECVDNPEICTRSKACVTRDLWGELQEAVNKVLESTTLGDLVERQKAKVAEIL